MKSLPLAFSRCASWSVAIATSLIAANAQDPELIGYWDFESEAGGVVTDVWAGHTGVLVGEAVLTDGGQFGNSLDTSALNGSYFLINGPVEEGGDGATAFSEQVNAKAGARDQLTVVFWQRNLAGLRDQCAFWMASPSSSGTERGAQGHTPWSNDNLYFDTAGCCDGGTQRINGVSGLSAAEWMEWNHFAFVKDGTSKSIWVNGMPVVEGQNSSPLPTDIEEMYFGNGIEKTRDQPGLMDELGVIAGVLSEEQLQTLAGGATVIEIFDNSDPGINLNNGQTLNAGQLPALTGDQEIVFAVRNTGKTQVLNLNSVQIMGGDTSKFSLTSFPATLDPGEIGELVFSFNNEGDFGAFEVALAIQTNDTDPEDQNLNLTVRAAVLNPVGPAAHYRFDETEGDVAADSTAFGRNGAYVANTGSVTLGEAGVDPATGTAIAVSGGGQAVAPGNALAFPSGFTWAVWIEPASLGDLETSDFRTIIGKGEDNPAAALLEASGDLLWFGDAGGGLDVAFGTDNAPIAAGTPYHVAMRFDATTGTGTIFINGSEVASGPVSYTDAGSLYIGAFGPGALGFDGKMDDAQLFNIALEDALVQFLYENPGAEPLPVSEVDTDADGLTDNEEATLGTNPLNPDTDGDLLPDGAEVSVHTTDPLSADTDGDTFSDSAELYFGGDPLSAETGLGTFVVRHVQAAQGLQFTDLETFQSALDNQAQIGSEAVGNFTYINFMDNAQGHFTNDELPFPLFGAFGDFDDHGIFATGKFFVSEAGVRTFGVNSDDGFQLLIDGEVAAEFPAPRGSADTLGAVDLAAGEHELALYFYERGGGAQVELFVNTELGDVASFAEGKFVLLPAYGQAEADSDGDGLVDFWEQGYFGNLAQDGAGDPDSDSLDNLAEQENNTNPTLADTDSDGLDDGEELANNPATDPTQADTDRDGLQDGAELAAGTNPTQRDSDGDGYSDGFEAANGYDPLDPSDPGGVVDPSVYNLLAFWDFNDAENPAIAVDAYNGIEATVDGAAYSPDGGGVSGQSGDHAMRGSSGQVIVADASFLNPAQVADKFTFSFWQYLDSVVNSSTFWATSEGAGGDRAAQAHVPWGDGNIYFDTSGCCAAGSQRLNGVPAGHVFTGAWHHYAFVKDGPNKSVWINGVQVLSGTDAAPLPGNFIALYISGEQNGTNLFNGLVDDFAVYASALPQEEIERIAGGGAILPTTPPSMDTDGDGATDEQEAIAGTDPNDPSSILRTEAVDHLGAEGLELSWSSVVGKSYNVEYSIDQTSWAQINPAPIVATEATTSFTDTDAARLAEPEGYYRAVVAD